MDDATPAMGSYPREETSKWLERSSPSKASSGMREVDDSSVDGSTRNPGSGPSGPASGSPPSSSRPDQENRGSVIRGNKSEVA